MTIPAKQTPGKIMFAFIAVVLLLMAAYTAPAAQTGATASSPFATKTKVSVDAREGALPLKHEEKIAFMFMSAISTLEDDCRRRAGHACPLAELVKGPKSTDDWPIRKLKFDPVKADPNYAYKISVDGKNWEAWATPAKPGLGGFYNGGGSCVRKVYYNPKGAASLQDQRITGSAIDGDSFTIE